MARLKRNSTELDRATLRIAGMKTIGETLDFGNGLNLAEYEASFLALQNELVTYNEMLESIDRAATQIREREETLRGYSERMLLGVMLRYGKTSLEYRQAGGKIRKSTRKRSTVTPESETGMLLAPIASSAVVNPTMAAMN